MKKFLKKSPHLVGQGGERNGSLLLAEQESSNENNDAGAHDADNNGTEGIACAKTNSTGENVAHKAAHDTENNVAQQTLLTAHQQTGDPTGDAAENNTPKHDLHSFRLVSGNEPLDCLDTHSDGAAGILTHILIETCSSD